MKRREPRVPEEIRWLPLGALPWLLKVAEEERYSARGDRVLIEQRFGAIERAYILVHGPDILAGFRCVIAVFFDAGDGKIFTLDVQPAHFKKFRPLKAKELTSVAREFFYLLPGPDGSAG